MQPPRPPSPKHIEFLARGLTVRDGKVLVCRSVEGGYCYLPGGHVEPGEAAAAALAREFVEETGLMVTVGKLAVVSEERFVQNGKPRHELNLVFHVELPVGADHVRSLEPGIAFDWVPVAELQARRFLPESLLAAVKARSSGTDSSPRREGGNEGAHGGPWFVV